MPDRNNLRAPALPAPEPSPAKPSPYLPQDPALALKNVPTVYPRFGKRGQEKGGAERGFCWIFLGFEEEGVAVEGNRRRHWKEGQKLGGGAHQGQSGWSKTTGAMDL
ncbi:hypothetical protein BY996DRAFT_6512953 [Phakopsora pachyrhizi]|nr:hypothetical protein BY996DRAFT_6512953 [Phakopsora pachyrhizi]